MEAIKNIQTQQTNGSKQSTIPTTGLQNFSAKPNPNIYKANIMELLKRIRRLANAAPLTVQELELQAGDWAEILIDEVPLAWIPELYKRAAWNHPNTHMVNAFDLIAEFKAKQLEIATEKRRAAEAEKENNPFERCTGKQHHVSDRGEIVANNPHTGEDEVYPCPMCRKTDLENVRKTQIALYGEIPKKPITEKSAVAQIINHQREVYLSEAEAIEIMREYNILVSELVADREAQKNLFVFFDEGANRFRHEHTAAILFTADDMRKKIASYEKILESR